ncbi:hypothetical protein KC207_07720 [Phycicoccus sp. BSK3Z-2]|uniref:Uncharacterized protein n=1 Tax=Phycicoccus avicenniae TaxID=2828860 RepID=A0A941D9Z2_9MICO|nr:hypothetical protein [Phycicoccus avicenniae]MBR7743177.1 hypothetical protein [Phycicoccus avicenniae]
MSAPTSAGIADALGRAVLDGAPGEIALDPERAEDHLAIVARAVVAEQAGRDLLRQSVAAARASGHSWAAVGGVLGLSRQAAQQRFGTGGEGDDGPEHRWLGPVTAMDEMPELQLAGRRGWRTVGAGMLKHRMLRTDTQWEHRRVVWSRGASSYETDGWIVAVRAFPWLYLVRDLGIPPED